MIYTNKQRAIEAAKDLNENLQGYGTHAAALTSEGWTVRRVSPYSNGDVKEWA